MTGAFAEAKACAERDVRMRFADLAIWISAATMKQGLDAGTGAAISEAAAPRRKIAISTVSLAEVVYLIEKSQLRRKNRPERWPAPNMF